ncbi:MAG TPA: HlyD family efflux transporter periplasmic adaptor subunit, partial [Allocoleopsis sp.]
MRFSPSQNGIPQRSNSGVQQNTQGTEHFQVTTVSTPRTSFDGLEPLDSSEAAVICGGSIAPVEPYQKVRSPQPDADITRADRTKADRTKENYWSPTLQNLLDQPPSRLPMRFIAAGILFCCAFGAWAWFGRIQEVSYAQGRLVPRGEVYKVQPTAQAEVTQLKVKEGQSVKAGEVLAVLDNRLAEAEVDRLQQSLVSYRLQLIQLQGLMDTTRLEASSRRAIANAEIQAQEAEISKIKNTITTDQTLLTQLEEETAAYQARMARLQPLVTEGVVAQEQLFDVEQALREHKRTGTEKQGELKQSLGELARLQAELSERQATGQQSELEAQQKLQQLQREAAELQAKVTETETLLQAAQTKLQQMYLYAPVNGIISALNVKNVGEVTQPGQTIAEVIPNSTPLVLLAKLPTSEAGSVKQGMVVQIKFDAFPYQDYGIVPGKVLAISPDAKTDEKAGTVYQVEIAIDRPSAKDTSQTIEMKTGQTAT